MTKAELVSAIAEKTEFTKKDSQTLPTFAPFCGVV